MPIREFEGRLKSIKEVLRRSGEIANRLEAVCEELKLRGTHYSWVGIYLVEGEDLNLKAYAGPHETEHTRIRIGEGICGSAAETGRTEIVGDVASDPRYIACFPSTRSEIVVPIKAGTTVLGEIDIDSDSPEAFSADDRFFLETVAALIAPALDDRTRE
jgi:L-methionine (R)-S-oxide reductase